MAGKNPDFAIKVSPWRQNSKSKRAVLIKNVLQLVFELTSDDEW